MATATFKISGNVAKLWAARDPEVLFDGARMTGKTRPMCELFVRDAMLTQGTRLLIARKTRASMSQTTLVTLESVLRDLHPAALTGCTRSHVGSYWIGASEIVVQGVETEASKRSGEYAKAWFDEAHEITQDDWESVGLTLRWPVASWYAEYATSNPDSDKHFLWRRYRDGKLRRIQSLHADNPAVTPQYLARLDNLTGVRRKRFRDGVWCAAEGQVFDNWDDALHLIDCPTKLDDSYDYGALGISWYFASMDWGKRAAGCLQVWGVDIEGRIYQVAEVYWSNKLLSWWCERLVELNRLFKIQAIVCDPSRPDMIGGFNEALGYVPDSPDAIAFGADNRRASSPTGDLAGLDLVYEMLQPSKADGRPRMFFLRDNQPFGIDTELRDAGKPTSTVDEVGSYVWAQTVEGKPLKDSTDQNCEDHGWDAARYAANYAKGKAWTPPDDIEPDEPGTYGDLYGHNRLWEILKLEDQGHDVSRLVAAHKESRNGTRRHS